jgi:hypothetical protein
VIAPRLVDNVRRNLGLPVLGDLIDLPAYDVPSQSQAIPVQIPARREMSFSERLRAAGQVLINPASAMTRQYQVNNQTSTPITPTIQADQQPAQEVKSEPIQESEVAELQPVPFLTGVGNGQK